MSKVLIGIALVAGIAFLAFLLAVIVVSARNRRPGQTWAAAGKETVRSGWRSVKSRFVSPGAGPDKKPFEDMAKSTSRNYYTDVSRYEGYPMEDETTKRGMSSYNRPDHPYVFDAAASTPLPMTDIHAPGAEAYAGLAAEAMMEDLDAMAGRHRFGDSVLPAAPLTDDLFRYTGHYDIQRGDPLLSSPLVKTDIGISNRGVNVWDNKDQL